MNKNLLLCAICMMSLSLVSCSPQYIEDIEYHNLKVTNFYAGNVTLEFFTDNGGCQDLTVKIDSGMTVPIVSCRIEHGLEKNAIIPISLLSKKTYMEKTPKRKDHYCNKWYKYEETSGGLWIKTIVRNEMGEILDEWDYSDDTKALNSFYDPVNWRESANQIDYHLFIHDWVFELGK